MKRRPSLRGRLLLALMLMTLLTLAVASGLSAVMDLRLFRDHMLRDLNVLAAVVGESCVSALVFNSKESAEQRLATLAGEYQIGTATLYDAAGDTFARWERPTPSGRAVPEKASRSPARPNSTAAPSADWCSAHVLRSWSARRASMPGSPPASPS